MKRKNFICMMRPVEREKSNGIVMRNRDTDKIEISWVDEFGYQNALVNLTTKDARLLAKRINQFIDAGG